MRPLTCAGLRCVLLSLLMGSTAFAQQTFWIVDDDGGQGTDFVDIQSAVNAASSGDTLWIRAGQYEGFTAGAGSLTLLCADGAQVSGSNVVIENLNNHNTIAIDDCDISSRLDIVSSAGVVWLEDSSLAALTTTSSNEVILNRCHIQSASNQTLVSSTDSSMYIYDSLVQGPKGAIAQHGATAMHVTGGFTYLSGTDIIGGDGGKSDESSACVIDPCGDGFCLVDCSPWWCQPTTKPCCKQYPGSGGDGLVLSGSAEVLFIESFFQGGTGGTGSICPTGHDGDDTIISPESTLTLLNGAARHFDISSVVREGEMMLVNMQGTSFEHLFGVVSTNAEVTFLPVLHGPLLTAPTWQTVQLGVAPLSGIFSIPIVAAELPDGLDSLTVVTQGMFVNASEQGPDYLGSGALLTVLDRCAPTIDCNNNRVFDDCDLESGSSMDLNENGIPDECPEEGDCNGNNVGDSVDLSTGTSQDCNNNSIPDECETDCNNNGVHDDCDLASGTSQDCNNSLVPDECEADCNGNGVHDNCDVTSGTSDDCNNDFVPDECPGVPFLSDSFESLTIDTSKWKDIVGVTVTAAGLNEPSAPYSLLLNNFDRINTYVNNLSGEEQVTLTFHWQASEAGAGLRVDYWKTNKSWSTLYEITAPADMNTFEKVAIQLPPQALHGKSRFQIRVVSGESQWFIDDVRFTTGGFDCNLNGVPDECDLEAGTSHDVNSNGIPDECPEDGDCNGNGVGDLADLAAGTSQDCNANQIPDDCETDCNGNGVPDDCDLLAGTSLDDNSNGIPDECAEDGDCNGNGVGDLVDLSSGTSADLNSNGVPDECVEDGDCNGNGISDIVDISSGTSSDCAGNLIPDDCESDCNGNGVTDECDIAAGTSADCNADGLPDDCSGTISFSSGELTPVDYFSELTHTFSGLPVATDSVLLTFETISLLNQPHENLEVILNGQSFGKIFTGPTGTYCLLTSEGLQISQQLFNELVVDGTANIELIASHAVTDYCDYSYIDVTISYVSTSDCNENDLPDDCDIADGTSADLNGNSIPDECE